MQDVDFEDTGGLGEGDEIVGVEVEAACAGEVGAPGGAGGGVEVEAPFYVEACLPGSSR